MNIEQPKPSVLFLLGTRPEVIKLVPLVRLFQADPCFYTYVCVTGQHREMLDQMLEQFELSPDYDLQLMQEGQDLLQLMSKGLIAISRVLDEVNPQLVIVQGDTSTVLLGALAGGYKRMKVAHIEAGLRTYDKSAPFPEEINRRLVSHLADFHFTPTETARQNLIREGIDPTIIWNVGNTVVDTLLTTVETLTQKTNVGFQQRYPFLREGRRLLLVTCHRRETFGTAFEGVCEALLELADAYPDIDIIYPVHLNPRVRKVAHALLAKHPRIYLTSPLDYHEFVWLMSESYLVLTDSGGIQEEAPSLDKPVLVMRNTTEREEGIRVGTSLLVGTDKEGIVQSVCEVLDSPSLYSSMAKATNPYGDGNASKKIHQIIRNQMLK